MIKSLTVENYTGDEITINLNDQDPSHGLFIKSMTGLGPPKGTINASDYASLDGALFNSARVEKRNIVLEFFLQKTTGCDSVETARQNTYKYFPVKGRVRLMFETDNRLCEIYGYVESNEPEIFSQLESNQISIICPDPWFYRVGVNDPQVTNFSTIVSQFEFPFENNSLDERMIEFSSYETTKEKVLYYAGTVETGMIATVHIYDSVGNITFYNFRTKEWMLIRNEKIYALTGSYLKDKDEVVISTMPNDQYCHLVRDGSTINIINAVDRDSDWILLKPGDNAMAFTTDNETDENLDFTIENRVLYEGI